jgi:hypothetical protein
MRRSRRGSRSPLHEMGFWVALGLLVAGLVSMFR